MEGILITLGIFAGILVHGYLSAFQYILTNADSFAYLQMSESFTQLSPQGFGTGWFGFLYSALIAIPQFITGDGWTSALLINTLLFMISCGLLFYISNKYLHIIYSFFLIIIFTFSTSYLGYSMNVVSENLYTPLFLGLFAVLIGYLETNAIWNILVAGMIIGLMYLTRGEAFIYIIPIFIIILMAGSARKMELGKFLAATVLLGIGFSIFAAPYIYYLHSITGEWGLTNKGSANIRQAMMRGVEEMDDVGFEKAVGELTDDKKNLKIGFVGGLKYAPSDTQYSLIEHIETNPSVFFDTWEKNVKKLFTFIIPNMVIGDGIKYLKENTNPYYVYPMTVIILSPLFFIVYGFFQLFFDRKRYIIIVFLPIFITATIFFTMFFVLERYFIPFLPIFFIFMMYGVQNFGRNFEKILIYKAFVLLAVMGLCFGVGFRTYYANMGEDEGKYLIKKELGLWFKQNKHELFPNKENIRIMERFPVFTYYAGAQERWITPYSSQTDLIQYAKNNQIDLLVVDTLDFKKYRPDLSYLLDPESVLKRKELVPIPLENTRNPQLSFEKYGEKIILYKFEY